MDGNSIYVTAMEKKNAHCFGLQGLLRLQNLDLVHHAVETVTVRQ